MKIYQQSLRAPDEARFARHWRVEVDFTSKNELGSVNSTGNDWNPKGYLQFRNHSNQHKYNAVNRCVYCGQDGDNEGDTELLTDEHVIPEGLGARLILPKASCRTCQTAINVFETKVLKGIFCASRHHLKVRGKKRSGREKRNQELLEFTLDVGIDCSRPLLTLPLEEYPTLLLMPYFGTPGVFERVDRTPMGMCGTWARQINSFEGFRNTGHSKFYTPELDVVRFGQLLAKIGHCFAVSQLGINGFYPLLTDFIRQEVGQWQAHPEMYEFVGGINDDFNYGNEPMHQMGAFFWKRDERIYFVVEIRLFAMLGAPVYQVVVGEMVTPAQKADALKRSKSNPEFSRPA